MRKMIAISFFVVSISAYGVSFDILTSPPVQSTNKTCQSYSIAVGVSLLAKSPYLIDSEELIKESEGRIRYHLVSQCPTCTSYDRSHWQKAIAAYSSGQLKLVSKEFASHDLLYEYLYLNAPIKSKTQIHPAFMITLNKPSTGYFLSVTSMNGKKYESSHIVTVLGVDAPNSSKPGHKPPLLVLNSGDKNVPDRPFSSTQCIPWPENKKPKYIGSLSWVTDYTVNHSRLDWVDWADKR